MHSLEDLEVLESQSMESIVTRTFFDQLFEFQLKRVLMVHPMCSFEHDAIRRHDFVRWIETHCPMKFNMSDLISLPGILSLFVSTSDGGLPRIRKRNTASLNWTVTGKMDPNSIS